MGINKKKIRNRYKSGKKGRNGCISGKVEEMDIDRKKYINQKNGESGYGSEKMK